MYIITLLFRQSLPFWRLAHDGTAPEYRGGLGVRALGMVGVQDDEASIITQEQSIRLWRHCQVEPTL